MSPDDNSAVTDTADVQAASTESAPVENKPEAPVAEPVQNNDGSLNAPSNETEGDQSSSEDVNAQDPEETNNEDGEEKPLTGAEKRKEQLQGEIADLKKEAGLDPNTEIRQLVAEKNVLRDVVANKNAEVYKVPGVEEYAEMINPDTNDYYTASEARIARMEREREVEAYNNQVAESQFALRVEAERSLRDFPMFDEQSPEYNKELASQADALLGQNLVFDPNTGQIIGANISPYQIYKTIHDAHASAKVAGEITGQKNTEKMLARADTVSGVQSRGKSYEKMSLEEKEAYLRKKGHDI